MTLSRAAASILLALVACSSSPGGLPDGGDPDGGGLPDGGSPDGGGAADGGPDGGASAGCTSDKSCGTGRYCEKATGACRDAKPCPQGQGNCDYQFSGVPPDYCAGSRCFCDPDDSSCKPIHVWCSGCARNEECGSDRVAYDHPADCAPSDAGFADASVCIPIKDVSHSCPPGYAPPASGRFCVPGGGKCGAGGQCTSDAQCDVHGSKPNCDTAAQLCVAACSFNLRTGDSTCPPGQVCHLDPRFLALAPEEPNFAKGRCGPPCPTPCPAGLVCRTEGIDRPVQRCSLPPPQCLGDIQCPDSPGTHSKGYCDLGTHACKTDCRTNADCTPGFLCTGSPPSCQPQTCLEAGGAELGCDYGQFCCGQPQTPGSCPSGTDAGVCYDAPKTAWCGSCGKDSDCAGGAFPQRADAPNKCLDINNKKLCAIGCDPNTLQSCPRSWQCQPLLLACDQASDCGSQAGANCNKPDGGNGTCKCGSDADCLNDANNKTHCYKGQCIFTTICVPNCP